MAKDIKPDVIILLNGITASRDTGETRKDAKERALSEVQGMIESPEWGDIVDRFLVEVWDLSGWDLGSRVETHIVGGVRVE
jgi:hypothetical protein